MNATAREVVRVLHLGCGRVGRKLSVELLDSREADVRVVTLDADARLDPDLVCTLGRDRIDLADDTVDVAVAHHVLEHIGRQGETTEWFAFWEELYRVMKPDGELRFWSPLFSSTWAWSDPSHTRALSPQAFVFFNQDAYRITGSGISPFRIRCDFVPATPYEYLRDGNPEIVQREGYSHFSGVLRARKPFIGWWEAVL